MEYKDCRKIRIFKSKKNLIKAVKAFKNSINTFKVEIFSLLYCISSGSPVSYEIKENIFKTHKLGK